MSKGNDLGCGAESGVGCVLLSRSVKNRAVSSERSLECYRAAEVKEKCAGETGSVALE